MRKLTKAEQVALHRRDMAMRKKPGKTFGKLNYRYVFTKGARKGEVVVVKPTRKDKKGRPVISAKTMVRVFLNRARTMTQVMEARIAVRKMANGSIPIQQLRLVGDRA